MPSNRSWPVVGYLSSRSAGESETVVSAFRQGLSESGYIVGQNVAVEYRWAQGHYDRLPALAAELVSLKVAAILAAGGHPSALAAKKATATIPIIFSAADDPVGLGLVESLNRPGGNITGMSVFNATLNAKRLSLLHELVPSAGTIGYLANPANPSAQFELKGLLEAAKTVGADLQVLYAATIRRLRPHSRDWRSCTPKPSSWPANHISDSRRAAIVALAAKYAIPASYAWRENVVIGGLLSYGTSIADSYRNSGVYCGRILKGEKPGDLPVMQPTKFEMTINLKSAKALRLTIPPTLLTAADEVIE